ncbi:MAG: nucleotide sugar dehydrogenase [Kiloniellales bacterium]
MASETTAIDRHSPRISVVGLGYVGLPLAVALAKHYPVLGFDVDAARISELRQGRDRTGEVNTAALAGSRVILSSESADMAGSEVFIVTVPTPVDPANRPDLSALEAACATIGRVLGRDAIVVVESTVYPGVTETVCGPILEAESGLVSGRDFFLGYSPERINPGDPKHSVERITKVVAGQTPAVARRLEALYGRMTSGGVFVARDIMTAEAAKVIENAQRDINIAFMNEVAVIFDRLGLSMHDVLEAAATKWNFLGFTPGLVGGHCIGVDPYYLAHVAQEAGHDPQFVLAGRRINDAMGAALADRIARRLESAGHGNPARILVLGLTFKENVPDLRNSKVVDMVRGLEASGHSVAVHDPRADPQEAQELYGIRLIPDLDGASGFNALIGAVTHDAYRALGPDQFARLVVPGGLVADLKGMWRQVALPEALTYWRL